MVTYAQISPKMVNPRGLAGDAEEEDPTPTSSRVHVLFVLLEALL